VIVRGGTLLYFVLALKDSQCTTLFMASKTLRGQETLHLSSCTNQVRVDFFPFWSLIPQFQHSEPNPCESGFMVEHKY